MCQVCTYVGAHYVTSRAAAAAVLTSSFAMCVMFGR